MTWRVRGSCGRSNAALLEDVVAPAYAALLLEAAKRLGPCPELFRWVEGCAASAARMVGVLRQVVGR